ncbi:CHAT domain-containing protein [Nostoc sp. LEGE 06077]|nr:CHAT domain-containing tetratricopeptide repeat protein [Nostoc sp. LEGE 06077]MBE9207891.1 CHAT domain-containing protein [Nostoc sp. LEGE 06077]
MQFYNQSLPLRRQVRDKTGEAATLNNIGGVYSDLGDKQQTLQFYNQSLPLARQVGDKTQEAVTLNNIGSIYDDLGDKQQALIYYNQSLPLTRQVGNKTQEARTLNNIGSVYSALGDKQQALQFYNQSLPLSRQVGDKAQEARTLNNIGSIYNDLGDKQQALQFYNQSLTLSRQVGDKTGEATILNNIGLVYDALGDKQQALKLYNQSLPLSRQVGDKTGEARTLNNIGTVYSDLGDKQQALQFYNQSLPLSRQVGNKMGEAVILNNIGGVYDDLGDKQQALKFYNQSLPLARQVGDKAGESTTLYNLAYLERDRGNLQQALTQIEAAIELIENLRTKITNEQLRTSYFASRQGIYQFYIDLLMQLHKQNPTQGYDAKGWQASEKSRARSLIELLTEANADIRQGVEPKLLAAERNLQQRIDTTEKRRLELYNSGKYTPEQAQAIETEFASLVKDYQDIQAQIRFTSPRYAALTQPQTPSVPEIQQQILDDDTLLLQYSLGEQRSYLWMVSKTSISSYELPKRADIEILVKQFNYLLKIRSYSLRSNREIGAESGLGTFRSSEVVAKISQILLQPVADKLGNKRLLIVGDGALQYLPFTALLEPETVGKNIQPLIVKHEIISLPSASTLAIIRREHQGRKIAPKTLAIIADPVFSNDDDRLQSIVTQNTPIPINPKFAFERLRFTRQEAEAILALVPKSQTLQALDFAANRAFATSPQLSNYRLVHFATHGIFDTENPSLSGVVLSLFDKQGRVENGFLRLQDIFNLKLPAELIVLSACETGLSKEIKGEGLVGLTRGFMYAGSSRVLVSLWSVDDEATSELMQKFYTKILKQKLTPAAALRSSQLELWQENYSTPYYWAAFTLQGEWK